MLISRTDEANFPDFKSVEEARSYFQKRYGDKYICGFMERLDDDLVCYFDEVDYQPVQILEYEDGTIGIHVVY